MGAGGSKEKVPVAASSAGEGPKLGKSGKKICCSCPETKKVSSGRLTMSYTRILSIVVVIMMM